MSDQQVFLKNEVLTIEDLIAIRNGYAYSYSMEPNMDERYKFLVAMGTMDSIIYYLQTGKQSAREP